MTGNPLGRTSHNEKENKKKRDDVLEKWRKSVWSGSEVSSKWGSFF